MFKRVLEDVLKKQSLYFPVVSVSGPRQSGKTTLAKTVFSHLPYVLLEDPDIQMQATQDPRGFLSMYEDSGAIFDEIQNTPELLSYLQGIVDKLNKPGQFVVTGSQNLVLAEQISQTLAGRVGVTTLLPLSASELNQKEKLSVYAKILQGGYPRLHALSIPPSMFYPSYIATYVERDVRQIKQVADLKTFQIFLKLCAARVGQVVNYTSLAVDAGISYSTAREWLNILQTSYIVFFLEPYHENFNKRLIKMPKLYFYDTGVVSYLLGINSESDLATHSMRGSLFENLVILDLLKERLNHGQSPELYFWRDQTGNEIDCLADWRNQLNAIEIKSSSTFQADYLKSLKFFEKLIEKKRVEKKLKTYLVYQGQRGKYFETDLLQLDDLSCALGSIN